MANQKNITIIGDDNEVDEIWSLWNNFKHGCEGILDTDISNAHALKELLIFYQNNSPKDQLCTADQIQSSRPQETVIMEKKKTEIVKGVLEQEKLIASGWRYLSSVEVKYGGELRDEVISLLENPQEAATDGTEYKLKDGKMYGKITRNLLESTSVTQYYVVEGSSQGGMEFALMANYRLLTLTVLRGKGLKKMDIFGTSDPYVLISVVHRAKYFDDGYVRADISKMIESEKKEFVQEQKKTIVKEKTLNPEWNEVFNLQVSPKDDVLVMDIYDWNWIRTDKFIGRAIIELDNIRFRLNENMETQIIYELKKIPGKNEVWFDMMPEMLGKLFLSLNFSDDGDINDVSEAFSNAAIDSSLSSPLRSLPDDWEERVDQNGRTFYINHSNNSTQWERPIIGPPTLTSYSSQDGGFQMRTLISEDPTHDQLESEDEREQSTMPSAPPLKEEEAMNLQSPNECAALDSGASEELGEGSQYMHPHIMEMMERVSGGEINPEAQRLMEGLTQGMARSNRQLGIHQNLPAGWTADVTPEGRTIYTNHRERRSYWSDPRTAPPSDGDQQDLGPLPEGWEESKTDDGRTYFIDHTNQTSTWDDPRKALKAGSSEIIPYSRDYKAKYDAFIKRQTKNASTIDKIKVSDKLVLKVHRDSIFLDSYEEIKKIPQSQIYKLKARLWVEFEGETGLDYGGLAREWFTLMSQSMFSPHHGLFEYSANDNYTLQINPQSGTCDENHLEHFRFIGRVAGLAVFHRKLLDGFFIRPFYKMMLKKRITLADMEAVDAGYYKSLLWIRDNDPEPLAMTFSADEQNFGKTEEKELVPGGSQIDVTEENKHEYIEAIIKWRFVSRIKEQMDHLMAGFNDIIPLDAIQIFDEGELELLLSGIGEIDVDDWKENTLYKGYSSSDVVVQWFWKVVSSFGNEKRSRLLQFVTGTSRVPMNGFKELYGSSEAQLFTIEKWGTPDSLPRTHTCFNRIDLPPYTRFSDLEAKLIMAVEGSAGFEGVD